MLMASVFSPHHVFSCKEIQQGNAVSLQIACTLDCQGEGSESLCQDVWPRELYCRGLVS